MYPCRHSAGRGTGRPGACRFWPVSSVNRTFPQNRALARHNKGISIVPTPSPVHFWGACTRNTKKIFESGGRVGGARAGPTDLPFPCPGLYRLPCSYQWLHIHHSRHACYNEHVCKTGSRLDTRTDRRASVPVLRPVKTEITTAR